MKHFLGFSVVIIATMMAIANAQASCGPRVRRNWDALTATEKSTNNNALGAAMDSGAYIKFVEMHTEMQSETEAHKQCMFIYWYRLFLVVFENMIRGPSIENLPLDAIEWLYQFITRFSD